MANSKEQLLQTMRRGTITLGWGAVAAYGRGRLNHLLEQQYNERLDTLRFLPPFSQTVHSDAGMPRRLAVSGLSFGTPRLSFVNADLENSRALLTLNIIAGTCTLFDDASQALLCTFSVTEAMGYRLEMDIELEQVIGEVDRRGRVSLDLTHGANISCNLFDDQLLLNQALAEAMQQWFHGLPSTVSAYELGGVEFDGYDPLSPSRFILRTQAAPGARVPGAKNYGDGAVLVFIRVLDDNQDGAAPDAGFPYLIPDGDYSATLVLAQRLLDQVREGHLEVLSSLLFPDTHSFIENERHTPHDLAVFGNIDPLRTTYRVEPAGVVLQAGGTQQFVLHDGQGGVVKASRWRRVCLSTHSAQGHGEFVGDGLYKAPDREAVGRDGVVVVITAEVDSGTPDQPFVASTRALVTFDAMALWPQAATYEAGPQQQITLGAWDDGADIEWELLEPVHGELAELDGHRAVFVPTPHGPARPVVAQQVRALGQAQGFSTVLMVNAQQLLSVEPAYVSNLQPGGTTQLSDDARFLPGLRRRWRSLSGNGRVDDYGLFTAGTQADTQSSIALCEVLHNAVVYATGHSLIKQSERNEEATWKDLNTFTIKVSGGADNERRGGLYNNGYQQLALEVFIETAINDGKEYPLSVQERASLTLYLGSTPELVDFLDENEEGIGAQQTLPWAVRLTTNRFDLANANPRPATPVQPLNDRQWTTNLYLHSKLEVGRSGTFFARITRDDNEAKSSNDTTDPNSTIVVTTLPQLPQRTEDYSLERIRVAGGSRGPRDPEDDDFDFHLRTVDYWKLRYQHADFVSCHIVSMNGNKIDPLTLANVSMIRWESEYIAELMFSYTGVIFHDRMHGYPDYVQFDKKMQGLSSWQKWGDEDLAVDNRHYETGSLVVVNVRVDDMPFIPATNETRALVSKPLVFELRDVKGNVHYRRFSYLNEAFPHHRDKLEHISVKPDAARPAGRLTLLLDRPH